MPDRSEIKGLTIERATAVEDEVHVDARDVVRRDVANGDGPCRQPGGVSRPDAPDHALDRTARSLAVTAALSRTLTRSEVSAVVVEQGVGALGASAGVIAMLSASGLELEVVGAVGYDPDVLRRFRRFGVDASAPVAEAARTGAPVFLESPDEWRTRYRSVAGWQFGTRHGAWAALPLEIEGRLLGAMGLSFPNPRDFSEDERAFMVALSQQCAQAFERARLYDAATDARAQAEAAQRRFAFLAEVSVALTASLDQRAVLEGLARVSVPALGDWCAVDLVVPGGRPERTAMTHVSTAKRELAEELHRRFPGAPFDVFGPERVIRSGVPELYPEIPDHVLASVARDEEHLGLLRSLEVGSYMSVPLTARGRTIGALTLATERGGRRFGHEDLVLAEEVATRVALAVDNARLYHQARAAERAKAESLAILDTLFASAPVGVALWDRDLRYRRINDALAAMNGVSPHSHIGKTIAEVVPGLATIADDLRRVLDTGEPIIDREVAGETPHAPGEVRHWLATYYPVRTSGGHMLGLGGVFTDITARKRAEEDRERLYAELSKFKATLDTTLDGVFMFDPETLRFFYVNRGAMISAGYSEDELLSMTPYDLMREYDERRFRAVLAPLLAGKVDSITLSATHRGKDGHDAPVELVMQYVRPEGERGRVIAVVRDVTDRVEARTRLQRLAQAERALNAELKAIIRATDQAVLVFDPQGSVIFANPAADALFEGAAITRFEDVTARLDDPDGIAPRIGVRGSQGPSELRLKGSDAERWLEVRGYPVVMSPETARAGQERSDDVETILFIRDVTDVRRARVARDAFIGVLSHELRTPVTTIFGNSKLLSRADRKLSPEARREAHADIETEAERLYRLVEDLLVLARSGEDGTHEVATEPVLLQRVIPSVIRAERSRWPLVSFETTIPANMPAVEGDQTYVEQVIRNLLTNAAKYGGTVAPVRITVEPGDGYGSVRVLDEGPGFPPEEADRLFELFYRSPVTSGQASGAGIGLFVCRRLVEAMGGRIWAKRRPSGGAEFGFALQLFFEEDL